MALEHRIRRFHIAQLALLSIAALAAACSSQSPRQGRDRRRPPGRDRDGRHGRRRDRRLRGRALAMTGLTGTRSPARSRAIRGSSPTRVLATARAARRRPREIRRRSSKSCARCSRRRDTRRPTSSSDIPTAGGTWSSSRNHTLTRSWASSSWSLATAISSAACEAAGLDLCGIPESTLATQAPSIIAEYHGVHRGVRRDARRGRVRDVSGSRPHRE